MRARLRDLLEPLQYSAFRRVWVSGLLSQLGDWASRLALSVMVFDQTRSALASAAALGRVGGYRAHHAWLSHPQFTKSEPERARSTVEVPA